MKKLLTCLVVCIFSTGAVLAQYVDKALCPGATFTINSTVAPSSESMENGKVIAGATDVSYTIPADREIGVYTYIRQSKSADCTDWQSSNAFTVNILPNLTVDYITWAACNVDDYQTFAMQPDMYTKLYQWGRDEAWPATGAVQGWDASTHSATSWTSNPCPDGWKLPTARAYAMLLETMSEEDKTLAWAEAGSDRGNAVAGWFAGPASRNCKLNADMQGCIFFPASGWRRNSDGAPYYTGQRSWLWTNQRNMETMLAPFALHDLTSVRPSVNSGHLVTEGMNLRCIK